MGSVAGFVRQDGYWAISIDGTGYLGHRLAYYYVTGKWVPEIDHKDGDRSNNRFKNLRPAKRFQNNGNSNGWGDKKASKLPRGVYFHPADKTRYRAQIVVHHKQIHLGCFDTVPEAEAVYTAAAKQHFGEFKRD